MVVEKKKSQEHWDGFDKRVTALKEDAPVSSRKHGTISLRRQRAVLVFLFVG